MPCSESLPLWKPLLCRTRKSWSLEGEGFCHWSSLSKCIAEPKCAEYKILWISAPAVWPCLSRALSPTTPTPRARSAMKSNFPPELVYMVFDSLDLRELIFASHVCSRWRTTALEHRTYWSAIRVDLVSEPRYRRPSSYDSVSIPMGRAQLLSSSCTPIKLDVSSCGRRNLSAEALLFLGELAQHMHRVSTLSLHRPHDVVSNVLGRVPLLESLYVTGSYDDEDELPNWLATATPKLRCLILENVGISLDATRPFSNVEKFTWLFEGDPDDAFAADLPYFFPALNSLCLFCSALFFPRPLPADSLQKRGRIARSLLDRKEANATSTDKIRVDELRTGLTASKVKYGDLYATTYLIYRLMERRLRTNTLYSRCRVATHGGIQVAKGYRQCSR